MNAGVYSLLWDIVAAYPLRLGWKILKILGHSALHVTMYFHIKTIALSFCSGRTAQAGERLGRWFSVRFSAEAIYPSLLHRIQTDSGTHAASYTMGTGVVSPGNKAAGREDLRSVHQEKQRDTFAFTSSLTWDCYKFLWRIWKSSFSCHFWKVVLHVWSQDRV